MIVGLQLLPTESSGSTKREVYYKGEGTPLVLTKGKKERKRYMELYSGGIYTYRRVWLPSVGLFSFFFPPFPSFFFFEVNVCSMLMTPAVYYNAVGRLVSFHNGTGPSLLFSVGRHSVFLVTARPIENRMFIRKKEKK